MITDTPLEALPVLDDTVNLPYANEKKLDGSVEEITNKEGSYGQDSSVEDLSDRESALLVNGEPVIRNGEDVSNFLVNIRDDGDPALTFRSIALGTLFAGLGAAMCQVCLPTGPS